MQANLRAAKAVSQEAQRVRAREEGEARYQQGHGGSLFRGNGNYCASQHNAVAGNS